MPENREAGLFETAFEADDVGESGVAVTESFLVDIPGNLIFGSLFKFLFFAVVSVFDRSVVACIAFRHFIIMETLHEKT
ncbi:hypothetical protein J6Z19_07335 [bacterium]|nr:hypothetical protein [bacterium]